MRHPLPSRLPQVYPGIACSCGGYLLVVKQGDPYALDPLPPSVPPQVYLDVACDFRAAGSMEAFWATMASANLTYLGDAPSTGALPTPRAAGELPARFAFTAADAVFGDDPWRALAGFSRKVTVDDDDDGHACGDADDDACVRCFLRPCDAASGEGIPFIEFSWGYFFAAARGDGADGGAALWPTAAEAAAFEAAFGALDVGAPVGAIDVDAWQAAADLLMPLCRGGGAAGFALPASLFPYAGGALPGRADAGEELPDDPEVRNNGTE